MTEKRLVRMGWIGPTILVALAFTSSIVDAQSGVGVSPPRVELVGAPGEQVTSTVDVDNPSVSSRLAVTATLSDALLAPDGGVIFVAPDSHPNSLASWLAADQLEFELGPTERKTVTYTLTIPAGTPDGTYWGVMFFESLAVGDADRADTDGIGIISRVRVGHIIYLTVGQPSQEGSIVGMRFGLAASGPPAVRVLFQNTGSGLLRLNGHLELRNGLGELVQALEIAGSASFPGATHDLVFSLNEHLEPGTYTALAVLDFGSSAVILGESEIVVP